MTTRRSFLGLTAAAAAATVPLLSACGDDRKPAAGEPRTVKLIHPSKDPLIVWSVTYLAEDRGFYKEEGLTVERVLLGGGPTALSALLTGAGDANLSAPGELLAAVSKGQKLKTILAHTNPMPSTFVVSRAFAQKVDVTADSPLDRRKAAIGAVKGARLGITAPGSQTDGFTRLAVKQAGLDPAKDVQIVPLQTAANCIAALTNNQIDGFVAVPPAGETAVAQIGAVPLLVNQAGEIKGADALQGMTVQARAQDVEKNPDLYEALARADVRAMKALIDDPAGSGALLRKTRFGQLPEPVWTLAWQLMTKAWRTPVIPGDALRAWFDNGLVADAKADGIAFDDVADMRFATTALRATNWTPPSA